MGLLEMFFGSLLAYHEIDKEEKKLKREMEISDKIAGEIEDSFDRVINTMNEIVDDNINFLIDDLKYFVDDDETERNIFMPVLLSIFDSIIEYQGFAKDEQIRFLKRFMGLNIQLCK